MKPNPDIRDHATPPPATSHKSDTEEVFTFRGGITDYWSFTLVRDYLLLMPGLPHPALRMYEILRSMIVEASKNEPGQRLRRMSIDQLCWLLTDDLGKPISASAMYEIIGTLQRLKLIVALSTTEVTGASQLKGKEKAVRGILRGFQVQDLPPELYTGWRNAWDKLDAYQADWRESRPKPPTHTTTSSPDPRAWQVRQVRATSAPFQNSGTASDAPSDHPEQHDPFQESGTVFQDSGTALQESGTDRPPTSKNAAPKEVFPRSSPKKDQTSRPSFPDRSQELTNGGTDGSAATKTNPGVELLLAIGAEKPEFLLTGKTLRDQGLTLAGMLLAGWTEAQLYQVIAGRPLPQQVKTSVGSIVARRIRDALAGPPPASVPRQGFGAAVAADEVTPVPDSYATKSARGFGARENECLGDNGMCGRPVPATGVLCHECAEEPAQAPF